MDIVNDLGSDLAIAFLVEKRHSRKIALRDALALIERIRSELDRPPRVEYYGDPIPPLESDKAAVTG